MGMMNVPEMRRLARVQRFDFWIAVAAIVGTLVFGVLAGVIIGILLSLIWLVSVATRPRMPALGLEEGTQVFREVDEHPEDTVYPEVAVIRLDGGLFFATADAFDDRLRELIQSEPGLTGVVLDCGGINFIDSQGVESWATWSTSPARPASPCGWRASSRRCAPPLSETASSNALAPTGSTATSTAPSRPSGRSVAAPAAAPTSALTDALTATPIGCIAASPLWFRTNTRV